MPTCTFDGTSARSWHTCAGDSSLDNKYWLSETADAPDGSAYERVLDPPVMKQDVTYWLNQVIYDRRLFVVKNDEKGSSVRWRFAAINTAVEATTLRGRSHELVDGLLPQDELIRDSISQRDILIVSVGANDVVESVVRALGNPLSQDNLLSLFGSEVQKYIEKLVIRTKPARILVCMIYFPDEARTFGWANAALEFLDYNSRPQVLQDLIRTIYSQSTSNIQIDGSDVVPIPLFQVLDGKTSDDYAERVEPSASGGQKIANYLMVSAYVQRCELLLVLSLPFLQDVIETTPLGDALTDEI